MTAAAELDSALRVMTIRTDCCAMVLFLEKLGHRSPYGVRLSEWKSLLACRVAVAVR